MRIKRTRNQGRRGLQFPRRSTALGWLTIFCLVFGFKIAGGQQAGNTMKGFRSPLEYFPPPHELQVQSFLEGAESEVVNGMILLRQAKLQTFHEDGTMEMIVTAPQCVYDYNKHVVNSTGSLQVQIGDDKNNNQSVHLQGSNGFYWQQTNSLLIVSNKQSTLIRGSMTNSFTP